MWLLGDYFDQFNDTIEQVESTCKWLLGMCEDDRVHRLLGNHDVYYLCENKAYRGAGYTRSKHHVVQKYFSPRIIAEKFSLYGKTNGYLLTHAGFTRRWLNKFSASLLERHLEEAFQALLKGELHPLLGIGVDRGGDNEIGGVTWCDWRYFAPIPGVPQIVGHTPDQQVRWAGFERRGAGEYNFEDCVAGDLDEEAQFTVEDEVSLCLDTNLRHYAIIEKPGIVQVKRTPPDW